MVCSLRQDLNSLANSSVRDLLAKRRRNLFLAQYETRRFQDSTDTREACYTY